MSKSQSNDLLSIILGAVTATSIGTLLFQALGALILGVMGALGGYIFTHILKPKLDKLFSKKKEEKA